MQGANEGPKDYSMTDSQNSAAHRDGSRSPAQFANDPLPEKIGAMLRESYQEVVAEGIPDDFLNLLRKADDAKVGSEKEASK